MTKIENIPHMENVRLVEDASGSDVGAPGFNGRYALVLALPWLFALFVSAYLVWG